MKEETETSSSPSSLGGGILLGTDKRKSFECDGSVESDLKLTSKQFPMPVDLLESCLASKNVVAAESSYAAAAEKGQDGGTSVVTDGLLDSLLKADDGFDIQMIDDDGEEDDDDTGSVIEYESAESEEESFSAEEDVETPTVDAKGAELEITSIAEAGQAPEMGKEPKMKCSLEPEVSREAEMWCEAKLEVKERHSAARKRPLKSVLKKGTGRQNKGLKVTFHDTQIFVIDTEVEVCAEPQLLTVRSFDLPLALSDIRVFAPTFDFVPSLPPGSYESDQHYTYENAIVSFDDYDDVIVCRNNDPSSSPSCNVRDSKEEEISENEKESSDCPRLAALQEEPIVVESSNVKSDEQQVSTMPSESLETKETASETLQSVQSLTEANLKQHEILMEKDILVTKEEEENVVPVSTTPVDPIPTAQVATTTKPNSLSPPLKELTVDVEVVPGVEGSLTDDWQVELSPLNSIPESETESSTSSQDTIIMMTSDESRRNEEHIQHSMDSYNRKQKQDDTRNSDVSSTGSSQDSDETLVQIDEPQRTSDQIRQILERNADRRNRMSLSKIKKRNVDGTPVEKQRQWRSHESLLDTIKKLTLDEVEASKDAIDGSPQRQQHSRASNDDGSRPLRRDDELNLAKLSSKQVTDLIASPLAVRNLLRAKQQATNDGSGSKVDVPGDVRQWKIRSNLWNSLANREMNGFRGGATSSLSNINGQMLEFEAADSRGPLSSDDTSDELLQFVRQDSERIERIRKRYSYTDGDDYETVGSFARRPSVRGIKPRFGSTTEILKQMQSQLQRPPLSNPSNSHMTWPYPTAMTSSSFEPPPRFGTRQTSTLPVLQEEIYGTTRGIAAAATVPIQQPRIPTYSVRNDYEPVYRTRRGRENCYRNYTQVSALGTPLSPPPYQPPPPPPPQYQAPPLPVQTSPSCPQPPPFPFTAFSSLQAPPPPPPAQQNQSSPVRVLQVKGERGVPEGASSSPKVLFDSMYRHRHHNPNLHPVPQYSMPSIVNKEEQCHHQQITDNTGCVYYVMQV